MYQSPWLHRFSTLSLLLFSSLQASADIHFHDHDEGLFSFVTHPEIKAPRWKVNVTEPELVSPGYWFVAPFEFIDQKEPGNGWVGPVIYDGQGELIWSGVELSNNWDAIDFKISRIRGEDLITFLVQREGDGYILDHTYQVREKVHIGTLGVDFNSHEFNFIDDGKRAIVMDEGRRDATPEQALAVGYNDSCIGLFNGFKELDTTTWTLVFEWSSFEHVSLNESSFLEGGVDKMCGDFWGWDFVHLNSVDKDHNGDYYVSGRHTDSIYKVSKDDGHVMWRLHGRQEPEGEWSMGDLSFSRQHNVRFRGFNGTHEIITILDNAKSESKQAATHENSRGLTIALQVDDRVATIVQSIEHPYGPGSYAPRRGNYQLMANDHIFMGWSEQATHSEHSADGKLLMEATMATEWLGSYRSYKFDFVGLPTRPPRAVSAAYPSTARNSTTTMVHLSWNGATEVARWNLYKTTETGNPMIQIGSKSRTGFETIIAWDGYASYVMAEAIDKTGKAVGRTEIMKTLGPGNNHAMSAAVAEEMYWLQELHGENESWKNNNVYAPRSSAYSLFVWLVGVVCGAVSLFVAWRLKLRGYLRGVRTPDYHSLSLEHDDGEMGQGYHKEGTRDIII
ncbi:hypothetical protein CLAFUW4_01511 [Fulvia fulva]|uniref:ASST-domain-containing protein n=1 Tax=Passalora fulva TaxID=5499 RepID=A0A9Q8P402_PASFU|nr:uncharacterized protein CLAFUR5_01513 [Fulvia fulva]KAK4635984.1 hypothetical protein CLAFUR4_01512 [Fulvia fulva]KAK4636757.1 hypothetical protein CLAFUR0_01513 [Fulvia fulva]UJO12227.1 hypothetical protein CLAFUR5_01513 [Fulvia fulva]WPV08551.1 hypothetical protein CLAFUW4_01511 [Fulvia fulva]WPV24664.1 hypothetical protein CLAFUW7_01516 [Fulvia fulva]